MSIDDALIQCQKALRRADQARTNGDNDTFMMEMEAVQYFAKQAEELSENESHKVSAP